VQGLLELLFDVKKEAVRALACERVLEAKHIIVQRYKINTHARATQEPVR
jgi:hypothetical protein